jgi:putative sterol carrier protein
MAAYKNTEELQQVMSELWDRIKADKGMSAEILKAQLVVRFDYKGPKGSVTIDSSDGQEIKVQTGWCDIKPLVEMSMSADIAHEFWLGKLSVPMAILTGKMIAKGPVNQALALLPAIKPAFAIYPHVYETSSARSSTAV